MERNYIIAVDVGTSSTKTALWTDDGSLVAEATEEYPLQRPHASWAEADAMDWWKATSNTIRSVIAQSGVRSAQVVGIGVDGLGWSLVPTDRQGEPLCPATIWLDRRAEAEAAWLRSLPEADDLVHLSANPLDAAYITPKLLWLKGNEPEVFDDAYKFLTSSGFIVCRLTSQFSCDYTQAYGYHFFDIRRGSWDEEVAERIGIPIDKMTTLYPATTIVGELTRAAADALGLASGIPVIAGGLDACVGALGAGVVHIGQTVDQGGQAGGMLLAVDHVIVEPALIFSHHILPGQYLLHSGTVGGGSLSWFRDTLGQAEVVAAGILGCSPFSLMDSEVAKTAPGAHGLTFLPYMAGERTPLWNSNARGVFFGLSYKTTRGDILRAIMEGCAFAVLHNLRVAEKRDVSVTEWLGVGGASRSETWCQIKADVTNKPFVVAHRRDGGEGGHALGLYAMVAHALGQCDMATRITELLPARQVFEPSAERHAMYEDLFDIYLGLSQKLSTDFDRLATATQRHGQYLSA